MKIITDYKKLKLPAASSIAIGNFDGIHPGHKKIITKAVNEGIKLNIPSGIFTFKTHPKNLLFNKTYVTPILSLSQRLEHFQKLGVSFCLVCNEDLNFLKLTPHEFMENVLFNALKAKVITVGENFHFGENARGSKKDLKQMQNEYDFKLNIINLIKFKNHTISSTRIRDAIQKSKFNQANELLKRNEFFSGKIIKGNRIGSKIGIPTANLDTKTRSIEKGVYLVKVWLKNIIYFGVMNYGNRPTIKTKSNNIIEIHILDFKFGNLYGRKLTFQILSRIRKEKKFSSSNFLKKQILKDIKQANSIIKDLK